MMENVTETSTGHENTPVDISTASLGEMLRDAREHLGLSVMDVSSQIKFAPRQIEALEAGDFQHLPETAFLRGFVRSYAKILHLDAQTLLAALPQKEAAPSELVPASTGEPFPGVHSLLRQNLTWLGAALLLILIAAGFSLKYFTEPSEPPKDAKVESQFQLPAETAVSPAQPVPEIAVTVPESQKVQSRIAQQPAKMEVQKVQPQKTQPQKTQLTAAVAQSSVHAADTAAYQAAGRKQAATSGLQSDILPPATSLRLEFIEDSWAEIRDRDGQILSSRLHSAGSELTVNGHAPFSLLIGHASTVRLYYRNEEVDLIPYTRSSTDVASLTLE